jgi:hypothetical protein
METEIKPFGYDWSKEACPKCTTVGKMYRQKRYNSYTGFFNAVCGECGYVWVRAQHPADHEPEPLPQHITFKKNNIPYGQDHHFLRGIPTGIRFEVREPSEPFAGYTIELIAPNHGGESYGNGPLFVKEPHLREYLQDHEPEPPEPPWEPTVGERVVAVACKTSVAIACIEQIGQAGYVDGPSGRLFRVNFDNGVSGCCYEASELRPETRADREKRAKEIVANAQPGDRFRVIERPVDGDGRCGPFSDNDYAGQVITCQRTISLSIVVADDRKAIIAAWNLVPLPREAEEPKKQRWELVSRRHITQDDMGRKYYQFVNNAFRPISEGDVGCYAMIVRPLNIDLQIGRLQEKVDKQRAALRQLHAAHNTLKGQLNAETSKEVEAMRAFFDVMPEAGRALHGCPPQCLRELAKQIHQKLSFHNTANWLNGLADAYERVLDARGEK